jgi:hypothetical protein
MEKNNKGMQLHYEDPLAVREPWPKIPPSWNIPYGTRSEYTTDFLDKLDAIWITLSVPSYGNSWSKKIDDIKTNAVSARDIVHAYLVQLSQGELQNHADYVDLEVCMKVLTKDST